MALEYLRHELGLFMGHISISVAVKQECGRMLLCDVADRTKRVERLGLLVWIVTSHIIWP